MTMMTILSVSELNQYVARILSQDSLLSSLRVEGEISGGKLYISGHYYFTLKDSKAQISCVCFKSAMSNLGFKPVDGQHVIITGYATIYEQGGRFQIIVRSMERAGEGLLYAKFIELRDRLQKKGLFADERKKKIPYLPQRIGVVTSLEGAVIRDIVHILRRRFPGFVIKIFPVSVQGSSSIQEIVAALALANSETDCDVLIICRGGGSLEDLMPFNSEEVALAVSASEIPVISAVGHETDYTICDFVSDLRAPTPSAAAELVLPRKSDLLANMDMYCNRMKMLLLHALALADSKLKHLTERPVLTQGDYLISSRLQKLDLLGWRLQNSLNAVSANQPIRIARLKDRMGKSYLSILQNRSVLLDKGQNMLRANISQKLSRERLRLDKLAAKLLALDPNAVVRRGYARLSCLKTGRAISSLEQLTIGADIRIYLADGIADAGIKELYTLELLENSQAESLPD
jgi:exodeoxyribonuclease VII large subunit